MQYKLLEALQGWSGKGKGERARMPWAGIGALTSRWGALYHWELCVIHLLIVEMCVQTVSELALSL